MCSTPRHSGSVRYSNRLTTNAVFFSSFSEMKRNASIQFAQRQKELAQRRKKAFEKHKKESAITK